MYYSDKPIGSKCDDQLGRNGFAALLAQSLLNLNTQDTFTVGLFGKWGSGKTSIIILARLSQRKAAQKELDGFFHSPIVRGSLGNTTSSKLSNGPFFPERESLTYSARSITSLSISFLACAEGRAA